MGISYDNKKIIPAPFLQKRKNYITAQDGTIIGTTFNLSLEGTILPYKGSPSSTGTFWVASGYPGDESLATDDWLQSLIRKQEALRDLFSDEGKQFKVDGLDGLSYLICNPRVKTINFPKGNPISWANKCEYSIELEADQMYLFGQDGIIEDDGIVTGFKLESAEENWSLEAQDENLPLFRLSHEINAKGKRFYGADSNLLKPAWENARDWVISRQGINSDRVYCSGVLNLTNYSGFNYVRTQRQSDLGGTFGVTETWLIYTVPSGYAATEDCDINVRTDEAGLTAVSVQGRIQGLELRDNTTRGPILQNKFYNASGYYWQVNPYFLHRAQTMAGISLHPTPLGSTIGHNELTGIITYNYEYNNRATTNIAGARSEKINVSFQYATDLMAEISIMGRAAGPIFQNVGTTTTNQKTVTIEAIMPCKTQSYSPSMPNANALAASYAPTSYTYIILTQNTEQWDESTGRFTKIVSWKYNN